MPQKQTTKPRRILVANRGEIALRVIRAARELGYVPLAIYSEADRQSLHVSYADEAYCVGTGPSKESYLRIDKVLEAAKAMRADAVHPGYGFLSEKAEFAEAVQKAGLAWVGPPAKAITLMGDKAMARRTMDSIGALPLVPGTQEGLTDENVAFEAAKKIGFPLMIKALAGGGGRGMRLVMNEGEFLDMFRRASSEAEKAFADGRLYLERYVTSPHHIEVQIIADQHGNVCHLFDRECSVQRRHQKVIEEAVSPFVTEATRKKLCEAAVLACKELGYVNAGTIEFLMDDQQNFYFMEMNTRLQVEHPVTEWVTGRDLVKEQLAVAFGEKLSFRQEEIERNGHAIEFRINAEDPERFLPQAGLVRSLYFPRGIGVRVDSHLVRGYEIPVFYDSMVAKLSVWGRTREEAIVRGKAALRETIVTGVQTNIPFHLQILENERFLSGNYTTRLIGEDFKYRTPELEATELENAVVATALAAYRKDFRDQRRADDENSRWKAYGRWESLR
jgi:acetyl-CoA carboxylase biotin carboxylase subunit